MSNPFLSDGSSQRDFSVAKQSKEEENPFVGMFDDSEEELASYSQSHSKAFETEQNMKASSSGQDVLFMGEDPILKLIARNERDLRAKYPNGGIDSTRIITSTVLLKAEPGYFDSYLDDCLAGVKHVQTEIADKGKSEIIKAAEDNPKDKALVNSAYYLVHSYASEYINTKGKYRGTQKSILMALIINELLGYGMIEPLWLDRKIDEIMCNGPFDIQIEFQGELFKVPACRFKDANHMFRMLEKMYRGQGKTVSQTTPLVKGRLHDKSRIFTVHTSIAPTGPNLAVRRHPENYWTPKQMVDFGSSSPEMMSYLGNLIYKGVSMVVVGGTHSGKATTLDTEIQTPHGKVTMGDIQVGDQVIDHNGRIGKVLNKFPQKAKQVYEVKFSNNESVFCDLEHNWYVSTQETRRENIYKNENNLNDGWENLTIYNEKTLLKIRDLYNNSDNKLISYNEGLRKAGVSSISSNLEKSLSQLSKVNGKVSEKDFMLTLLSFGSRFWNDRRTSSSSPLYSVLTTQEMIQAGLFAGDKSFNFQVPALSAAIQYNDSKDIEDLPIHPYLLGVWLGRDNKSIDNIAISEEDAVDVNEVCREYYSYDVLEATSRDDKWSITIPGFKNMISDLNLNDNNHIPGLYLYASQDARRELIRGLIDSKSGSSNKAAVGWIIENNSSSLIKDFTTIVSSMGYRVSSKSNTKASFDTFENFSYLPEKSFAHFSSKNKSKGRNTVDNNLSIVSISPVEGRVEEMACITVDTYSSTYMVGDSFITTHNTSLLNALSGFYKPKVRIFTLEDNIEMMPNPKKFIAAPMETRAAAKDREGDLGVSMRDLVHACMQLRPDVIIVGEVTDHAAYDLVQALNTGHAGASTIHANTSQDAIPRIASLVAQSGLMSVTGALDAMASAFDIIVNVRHFPVDGSRRIVSIDEVGQYPVTIDGRVTLEVHPLWKFIETGLNEQNKITGYWKQVGKMSDHRVNSKYLNLEKDKSWEELLELSSVPPEFIFKKEE